jgi:siroheme synthase
MEFYSKRSSYPRRVGVGITHQGGSTPVTFVTVCTEVDATQERSHAGNHIVVVVMIVQVDLLLGCGSMVNDSIEMLSSTDTDNGILFDKVVVSKKSWRWNYTPRREYPYINAESKM